MFNSEYKIPGGDQFEKGWGRPTANGDICAQITQYYSLSRPDRKTQEKRKEKIETKGGNKSHTESKRKGTTTKTSQPMHAQCGGGGGTKVGEGGCERKQRIKRLGPGLFDEKWNAKKEEN